MYSRAFRQIFAASQTCRTCPLCNTHAPKVSVRKKAKCSPWIDDNYIEMSRDIFASYWQKYKKSRNALNNLNKKLKRQYFLNKFDTHAGD